ncbi:MAG: N-6 DNA methylase [Promethearchaeota archaeon]
MVNSVIFKDKFDLDLNYVNNIISDLEILLDKNNIQSDYRFKKWLSDFRNIYGNKETDIRLYICNSIIYFVGFLFISKYILGEKNKFTNNKTLLEDLNEFERKTESTFKNLNIVEFEYFTPFFSISEREDLTLFTKLILKISDTLFKQEIEPEHIFDFITQKLIPPILKHSSGEYYTPPFLVRRMVKESYKIGESVLDPCCGSGNFIIGLIKCILSEDRSKREKIEAINMIYGFDINPISIFISKVNVLFLLKEEISEIKLNFYTLDFLFQARSDLKEKFDLIIGNPPWYTYRDVDSLDYQTKLKNLAEVFKIKPRPKNILNLEISTLFFFKANNYYLKNQAKIFFVITKGVITGSHASRFRNFEGFSEIKIWEFDKKIEKIFNIDFICLYAQKGQSRGINAFYEIPSYQFALKDDNTEISYYNTFDLEVKRVKILVPFSIEQKHEKVFVKKLIPKDKLGDLLPLEESYYKPLFHKGADLNPRNLIFVKFTEIDDLLVEINPDNRIFKRAKIPWNKKEYRDNIVEKKNLFKVLKSTELVKFHVYDHYQVFLPLNKEDLSFNYNKLDKNSKRFYDLINEIYLNNKKETTTHNSLMENLNRWAKLINQRQLSKIKVVYNNSGSILNSAVVEGDFLITGDLSFYDTNNLNEAYYLSAILNSNKLREQIKIMKSSRHIFKLPFNIPIKKFDPENFYHQKLVEFGKKGKEIAAKTIIQAQKIDKNNFTKKKIQEILINKLKPIFNQIDEFFIADIRNS